MAVAYVKVNGERVDATHFAWDQCHKIYLICSDSDREAMVECGYGDDIYSISLLPQAWKDSCGLRFIGWADMSRPDLVSQWDPEPDLEWVTP